MAPARRSQRERRAESERRLIQAAAELIAERGIQNTSLVDIGKRAGCSHALVTHLFGSKMSLVERLNDAADEYYADRAAAVVGASTGFDTLVAVAGLYLGLVSGPDAIGRVHLMLWTEAIAHARDIRPSRAEWDEHFRSGIANIIRDGIAHGSIDSGTDAAAAALLVVGLLRGVALQMMMDPTCIDPAQARAAVAKTLGAMLQPH
jgi:AcrR family transcriptional regulator